MTKAVNRLSFHSTVSRHTQAALKELATKHGVNQGRIIDYLVSLYQDQILKDNKDSLQNVKEQLAADKELLAQERKEHLARVRRDNSRGKAGQDTLTNIF